MSRLSRALGMTDGQVWTLGLGLLLASVLMTASLSAVLAQRPEVPDGLRVVEAGWSTAGRATGVPPGQVAVGSEVGRTSETAYLRLAGDGALLRLPVNQSRSLFPEDAALRVCRLATAGWTAVERGPGVAYLRDDCAPVRLDGEDAVVDLSRVPGRTDRTGFALLPALAGDAVPRTFRLVLDPAPRGSS